MTEQQFIPKAYSNLVESGMVTWQSPSNIALVKYWGKRPHQIPANPSISFTLSNCKTNTILRYSPKSTDDFSFDVFLDGNKQADFRPKIQQFFERILPYAPFLKSFHFDIETSNTFPHSSGIASSASGMSALAICVVALEELICVDLDSAFLKRKASFLARLGSGSACRSIEGGLVVWGKHNLILGSSSSMENNLFWKNVLVPRMSEKFGVQCVASSLEATEAQQTSSNLSSSSTIFPNS